MTVTTVDAFTDRHPAVRECLDVFQPPVRRFAGIILDVVFDYLLARDWNKYSDVPLEQHVEDVHSALNEQRAMLPPELQRFAAFMQRENILLGNRSFTGVEIALDRLSRRSPRFAPMAQGAAIAAANEARIAAAFDVFFPELLALERSRVE